MSPASPASTSQETASTYLETASTSQVPLRRQPVPLRYLSGDSQYRSDTSQETDCTSQETASTAQETASASEPTNPVDCDGNQDWKSPLISVEINGQILDTYRLLIKSCTQAVSVKYEIDHVDIKSLIYSS